MKAIFKIYKKFAAGYFVRTSCRARPGYYSRGPAGRRRSAGTDEFSIIIFYPSSPRLHYWPFAGFICSCIVGEIERRVLSLFLQTAIEVMKKLDDVRVLESRKSARLMDQDTDFARLADMSDRKRSSSSQNAVEING